MYELSREELKKMEAEITTGEICQQPELWQEVIDMYKVKKEIIDEFLDEIKEKEGKVRVIFTGAGTSQYVGDTLVPYLNLHGDHESFIFQSVGTTDIVASPEEYLFKDDPTLLVSFARSGGSPESIAAVKIANKYIKNVRHMTITCAKEGKLAQNAGSDPNNLLLLMPGYSNDKGFAMTGSFSCMVLSSLLIFDKTAIKEKANYVQTLIKLGREVIEREKEIKQFIDCDYNRIIYLGSGSLAGLTREAQLKVLELTAGKIATVFDSSMGFRHGPKSFVDNKTIVFDFVNNNPYTRQYDIDILEEIHSDDIAAQVVAIAQPGSISYSGNTFEFTAGKEFLPDGYLALADIMFAQTVALYSSIKVGNTPDTPSPTGTVNRVVKGVTIHSF